MKKHLFLLAALFSLVGLSNAQFTANPLTFKAETYTGDTRAAKTSSDNDLVWGYCASTVDEAVGIGSAANLSGAIHLTAKAFGLFEGATISGVNIGVTANVTNLNVFIRSTLTGNNIYSQTVGSASKGWNSIVFNTPFTIPAEGFYIGYSCYGSGQMGFSGLDCEEGTYLKIETEAWENYNGSGWGSLCIQAVIDGTSIDMSQVHDVGIQTLNNVTVMVNETFTISGTAWNNTGQTITSFVLEYTIGESAPIKKTTTCNIAPWSRGKFSFEADAMVSPGKLAFLITIKEVNGKADTYAGNNLAIGEAIVIKYIYPKKVVVEEGTGTWCGWCPRGAVGLAEMKKKYPETFIGIAVHAVDAMEVPSYINNLNFSGYPSCKIQRKYTDDPGFSTLEPAYQAEIVIPALAGIELAAGINAGTNKIDITSTVTFGYAASNQNYRIAYVLMENDVTGYTQTNYYSGGSYGVMGGWEKLPNKANVPLEDVARGIFSEFTGVPNSIPASVEENIPFEHNYLIDIPASIQDKDQLELVAMIIDVTTGVIVNADKVHLTEHSSWPIKPIALSPAHKDPETARNATVSATFNTDINISDLSKVTITPNPGNVSASISGTKLSITHNIFNYGTEYTVSIPANAIEGCEEAFNWSFTTIAVKPVSFTPTDGAIKVKKDAKVSATFNENISGSDLSKITITPNPGNVSASINGKVLNISHDDFEYETEYTVTIPVGSIENCVTEASWSFTTESIKATTFAPTRNATDVAIDAAVSVTFSTDIAASDLSSITITPNPGNVSASINGKVLNISHNDFEYETKYTVTIPVGSIKHYITETSWSFTTKSIKATTFAPSKNATDVAIDAAVSVTFSTDITASDLSGITITPNPGNVSASINGKALNISHDDFEYETEYTVTIPVGSIKNYATETSWSFTTKGINATTFAPSKNATDVAIDATVSVSFSADITASDLSGIAITPDPGHVSASIDGKDLMIAHDNFAFDTEYTVTIPGSAINGHKEALSWTFTTVKEEGIENIALSNVNIFPNPAKDVIHIEGLPENSTITLFDLSGKKLSEYQASRTLEVQTTFAQGIYLMRIEAEGATIVRKLIIE